MSIIKTKSLRKEFNGLTAVNDVSFEVNRGEIFGFLGPNGAGKTTTVRMLTGVLGPDYGDAEILNKSIKKDMLSIKEMIGVAPEESNAYRELSSWQNLRLMGGLYGLNREEFKKRAKKLLKEFGLFDRRKQKIKKFSKGMKQRLTLAMSLLNDPEILFLDEPTSGLDVQSQRLIRNKIKSLNRDEEKTIFLTTHNISEADQLCDRIAIIKKGDIITVEKPEKLKNEINKTKSIIVSMEPNLETKEAKKFEEALKVEKIGDKFRIYSKNIHYLIQEITKLADKENKKILCLKTMNPSLEDVFTKLTEK